MAVVSCQWAKWAQKRRGFAERGAPQVPLIILCLKEEGIHMTFMIKTWPQLFVTALEQWCSILDKSKHQETTLSTWWTHRIQPSCWVKLEWQDIVRWASASAWSLLSSDDASQTTAPVGHAVFSGAIPQGPLWGPTNGRGWHTTSPREGSVPVPRLLQTTKLWQWQNILTTYTILHISSKNSYLKGVSGILLSLPRGQFASAPEGNGRQLTTSFVHHPFPWASAFSWR